MPLLYPRTSSSKKGPKKRSYPLIIIGACALFLLSGGLLYTIVTGSTRVAKVDPFVPTTQPHTSSTVEQISRRLDGVPVTPGAEALRPISVMIDNQIVAQPLSGVDQASLVIESPVEGGITRIMAFFDPMLPTSTVIGPVRSARPYFVEWASAWQAGYAHVGGSPESLDDIRALGSAFSNIDEMAQSAAFFRDRTKSAPHNVYSTIGQLAENRDRRYGTSTATYTPWRFEPLATSTDAVISASSVRIPYGGSYSVQWKYDPQLGLYQRLKGNTPQKTREGKEILAANVAVIKATSRVLDAQGRLSIRTIGSGDAVLYRAGKKYIARWSRAQDEPMRFEGADGSEYPLTAGTTWIQVTTDDRIFAGMVPLAATP